MSNDDVLAAQIKSSIITKIKTQEYLCLLYTSDAADEL